MQEGDIFWAHTMALTIFSFDVDLFVAGVYNASGTLFVEHKVVGVQCCFRHGVLIPDLWVWTLSVDHGKRVNVRLGRACATRERRFFAIA
jgi:hypothetical protein